MNQSSSSDLAETRATVDILTKLIDMLHPVLTPDILTAYDFEHLYGATGLNHHAQREIARMCRIINTSGSYLLAGLCEFHVGLIYLHWGHTGTAGQHFVEARRQWQFTDETASICLTYFAEGRAHQHAQQYEAAMSKYGKVGQCLPQVQIASAPTQNGFEGLLLREMQDSQTTLRQISRPTSQTTSDATSHDTPPKQPPPQGHAFNEDPITQAGTTSNPGIAAPILNFGSSGSQSENPHPFSPLPGHQQLDPSYVWYKVETKQDQSFLPWIGENAWVLVQRKPSNHAYQASNLIVVMKSDVEWGGIVLRQYSGDKRPFSRIYLARSQFTGRFTRPSDIGAIQLSSYQRKIPVYPSEIEGLVVGFWRSIQYAE